MNYLQQFHTQPQILRNRHIGFAPHLHDEVEIVALFEGSAILTANGQRYSLQAGDFAFLYPGCVHGYTSEGAVDVGKIIFSARGMPELERVFEAGLPQTPVIDRAQLAGTGIPALAEEVLERYARSTAPEQKAYLFLLAARLLPYCPPQQPCERSGSVLSRVQGYCREHYHSDLTLEKVAAALFVSPSRLSHLFSDQLGIGFRDYLNLLRLEEAETLLLQTDCSITEIAGRCGFGSVRTFDRAFLRHRGMTPRAYRGR